MRIPSSAYLEFACWKSQRIQNIIIFFIKCALKLQRPGGNRREFINILKIDAAQLNFIITKSLFRQQLQLIVNSYRKLQCQSLGVTLTRMERIESTRIVPVVSIKISQKFVLVRGGDELVHRS